MSFSLPHSCFIVICREDINKKTIVDLITVGLNKNSYTSIFKIPDYAIDRLAWNINSGTTLEVSEYKLKTSKFTVKVGSHDYFMLRALKSVSADDLKVISHGPY